MISIKEAGERIRKGGLVAFPTETVYGLGANALDAAAVAKIYELKGRPATSPLIVHAASIDMARTLARDWPPEAEFLAQKYWPGPLTLVLPKAEAIPDIVTAGLDTVGIRVPKHPIALELIREAGVPIAAPSANGFMQLSPTTAEHVRAAFGDAVPVLDGGPCEVGIESTVVSIDGGKITLLRPGMISLGEIEQAAAPEGSHPAPGMHERHYSPRTPLYLVNGPDELPGGLGFYVWREKTARLQPHVHMPAEPEAYAAKIYGVLHELDGEGWPWIAVEAPPDTPEWAGVLDRLRRAAVRA
jgi:L-threonylcarbamoyladenylate synthase